MCNSKIIRSQTLQNWVWLCRSIDLAQGLRQAATSGRSRQRVLAWQRSEISGLIPLSVLKCCE